jgi:sarcosine oxidase subunit alpha
MDASTLGKIDVQGPDAGLFLDRLYLSRISGLKVGRARYAAMCRLDGVLFDDGVIIRTGPHRFFVTTSTSHAGPVMEWMEEWLQTEWPDLRVWVTSITEQWATAAIVGPESRQVLQRVTVGLDLSKEGFPFMAVGQAEVAGFEAQVARVSFSGELAFEVSVPGYHGLALWQALMAAGAGEGITPYGLETLGVLRAEKGYLIVGQDTDASTTPIDAGLGWMIPAGKDFLGRRSLARSHLQRPDRHRLVGFLPDDPTARIPEGAQLVADPAAPLPMTMVGYVTSSYRSEALGRTFGLAMVRGGPERIGERLYAPLGDRTLPLTLVDPVFYDREGARRDG